jgi:ABC-2 type transport system ATP-binding protein
MSTSLPAIQIKNLTKMYNQQHGIRDISLDVAQGEVFGFLGPNGAGKSTTINTMIDQIHPDQGSITLLGLDNRADAKKVHRRIGYLAGDIQTDPSLTGRQYLEYAAHLHGNVDRATVDMLVHRLRSDTATRIKRLSRGNRQKIGLIAALMHDPDILVLDEPTSGLDPLVQAEFNAIIREHKARGKTTFVSSHILSEVQSICDRVGFIRDGSLVRVSSLTELMTEASHHITVHFKKKVPSNEIRRMQGVDKFIHEDGTLDFDFNGDINKLITILHTHPINNIHITEPNLEDLFMGYYQDDEKEPANV